MNITSRYLLALSLSLLVVAGCQQRVANVLLGKWVGHPDTAAQRKQREAEKYGDKQEEDAPSSKKDAEITDWEAYDVKVTLEFVSRSEIKFSLQGEQQPIAGTWSIVSSDPSVCAIEVKTPSGEDGADELRRYRLELDEREGELYGFLLTEVGSDRGLGALYFQRAGVSP